MCLLTKHENAAERTYSDLVVSTAAVNRKTLLNIKFFVLLVRYNLFSLQHEQ